jgi:uncharacterized membrane protein HdeD (DUF308 family)
MLQLLFKKWWMLLIQGILLIILAFYAFNNPGTMLVGLSFWLGILVFGTGIAGIIAYFSAEKAERENMSLMWSILSVLFGLLMLGNMLVTMKMITLLFGIWMLATGAMLAQWGWDARKQTNLGWVMLITGILSAVAGIMMLFNMGMAAVGISTLLGLQALFAGLGFIVFSLVKRSVGNKVKGRIVEMKKSQ